MKSHVKVCKAAACAEVTKEEPMQVSWSLEFFYLKKNILFQFQIFRTFFIRWQVSSVTLEDGQKIEVAAPRKLNIAVYV